jgi:hypothetical protein
VRNIVRFVAVTAAMLTLAGFASTPQVSAQTPEPVDSVFDVFTTLSGFESGVARTFSTDSVDATPVASPDAEVIASPVVDGELTGVTTVILQFETDNNAISAMAKIQTEIQGENPAISFVVETLGDKTAAFSVEGESGVITGSSIVVQDGDQVIVVVTEGAETEDLATDLATSIVDTEAGVDEPQFSPDGTSTGGEWDRLPAADDPSLSDLPVVEDTDLQPTQA